MLKLGHVTQNLYSKAKGALTVFAKDMSYN